MFQKIKAFNFVAMNRIITENIDKIHEICATHHVKTLFAFGSVVRDDFNDQSDVDLLVSFKPLESGEYADNYFNIADQLESVLHRRVDLITNKSLSNPYFIQSVNQSKVQLYGE